MDALKALLSDPSFRRFAVTMLGGATVALNKRLGLQLEGSDLFDLMALVLGYVAQSSAKSIVEAHHAGKVAAEEVKTIKDAKAVLGEPPAVTP